MNILVTGGAGFIGSHLIENLLNEGHLVYAIDNFNDYYDVRIKRQNVATALLDPNYHLIEGDILDYKTVSDIFSKQSFDFIIHLAARAGVRPSIQQPILYQQVNCAGTINMLEMARLYQVKKFIFASSSSVYGNNSRIPFRESDSVDNPVSPYAATKKAGELFCHTYHHLFNISVTCLRFFTVYGPRQRPDMAISKFTRLIDAGKKVPMFGDGTSRRDYTYIDDIVSGIRAAIAHCNGYHIYNLGESRTIKLTDLIQLIASFLGKQAQIECLPFQPGDVNITYADISLAQNELGYHANYDMESGIQKYVEWYKAQTLAQNTLN